MRHSAQLNERAAVASAAGAEVVLEGLKKSFGSHQVVKGVDLKIGAGEFVSLLGASGSGKSTMLMSLAGFLQPDAGRMLVGGQDITPLPAHRRNIGMVFQNYALFPHMTAAENVAFPLRMRGVRKSERLRAAREALELMRLGNLADRLPAALSGGQQQRVALARALVFRPPLLLMDEPLSALDKKLREDLQTEIRGLQQRLGLTVVFVTHDQDEALTMSDRIAIVNDGRIEQLGRPEDLYLRPSTLFVADFMGDSNLIKARVISADAASGLLSARVGDVDVAATFEPEQAQHLKPGAEITLMVRPEKILIGSRGIAGRIVQCQFKGPRLRVTIDCNGTQVVASNTPQPGAAMPGWTEGQTVSVAWAAEDARAYVADRRGGAE